MTPLEKPVVPLGVEIVFRPFIKVEGLSSKEFRQSKVNIPDYSAIILTARTAIDHFFRLCKELRYNVPDTLKYFCVSETIAHYLQKYVIYRKRKIFYSESGLMEDLIPIIAKHNKETYLMPVSDVHNDKTVVLDNNKVKYVKSIMYRTVSNDFKPGEKLDYDMLVFFTPAGIKSYITNFPDYKQRNVVIAAMGQTTLEAAAQAGINVDVTITPEAPSMAGAIALYLKKERAEEEKVERKAAREAAKLEKERQELFAKRSPSVRLLPRRPLPPARPRKRKPPRRPLKLPPSARPLPRRLLQPARPRKKPPRRPLLLRKLPPKRLRQRRLPPRRPQPQRRNNQDFFISYSWGVPSSRPHFLPN